MGNKTFLVYGSESMSFEAFFQTSDRLAAQLLHGFQIQTGDRIAIAMRNYPEWLCAFYAIVSIGAVAVPLNSWGVASELIYGLTDARAKLLFCDQARLGSVADHLASSQTPAILVRGQDPGSDELAGGLLSHYRDLVEADIVRQDVHALEVKLEANRHDVPVGCA